MLFEIQTVTSQRVVDGFSVFTEALLSHCMLKIKLTHSVSRVRKCTHTMFEK